MASELPSIPEPQLAEFLAILRAGLDARPHTSEELKEALWTWHDVMEAYLKEQEEEPE